ncbi:MAG TPA: hypothetical protein VFS21_25805, partial [Roseiflexaceae bacterium]|nr:hypothetical protein [Roseiflexaceae bacterium]
CVIRNPAFGEKMRVSAWKSNLVWNAAKPSAEWNFPSFTIGMFPALWAGNMPMVLIVEFLAAAD